MPLPYECTGDSFKDLVQEMQVDIAPILTLRIIETFYILNNHSLCLPGYELEYKLRDE